MKIKFVSIRKDERFVHKNKPVNIGDVIDIPKERAEELIARGKAEAVKEAPKKKDKEKGGLE